MTDPTPLQKFKEEPPAKKYAGRPRKYDQVYQAIGALSGSGDAVRIPTSIFPTTRQASINVISITRRYTGKYTTRLSKDKQHITVYRIA